MLRMALRLSEAHLVYPPGEEVHTAASGLIPALHEYFFEIDDGVGFRGEGEIRANIAFITHTPEAAVAPGIVGLAQAIDWRADPADILATLPRSAARFPKISRAVIENALVDGLARRRGQSAAEFLGAHLRSGAPRDGIPCNQCVFWGSDENMRANAERYVRQGFRDIKLRIGIGTLEQDYARLAWLRDRFGDAIRLAVDANGAWTATEALTAIARLRPLGFKYLEQPTIPGDWAALETVASESDVPLMLDEGLQAWSDVERLCAHGGRISAHLKIAKAGGAVALVEIGRKLQASGVGFVMGQMNEGVLATAIAVHCGMALDPMFGELYGALGILNDPASGVDYGDGRVRVRPGPGTGVSFDPAKTQTVWTATIAR